MAEVYFQIDFNSFTTGEWIFSASLHSIAIRRLVASGTTAKLAAACPLLTNSSSDARSTRTRSVTLPFFGLAVGYKVGSTAFSSRQRAVKEVGQTDVSSATRELHSVSTTSAGYADTGCDAIELSSVRLRIRPVIG